MKKKAKKKNSDDICWVIQLRHPKYGWIVVDRTFTIAGVAYMIGKIYEECGAKFRIKEVSLK